MAKSSSRKSLKSLFSRSEANLSESTAKDVDKNDGEKKRFKFFRIKKKSSGGPASEKPANEGQQVLYRAGDPPKENRETRTATNAMDQKKTSLYATAPRSKAKEFSYSETDLSKPKRFATFAFGLRKRKKKDGDILSKSAFGLQSTGIEEKEEPPPDLSQMELDQTIGKRFSMSQPELDTSGTFDIPSPPPVATNQSDSNFPLAEASQPSDSAKAQPEAKAPLINGSSFLEVHTEPLKAPIATIPELQLEGPDLLDLAKNDANSPALMTRTDTTSEQPVSTPPLELNTADLKAAVVDLVCPSNGPSDGDSLQHTKPETSPNQPDTPDVTDGATLNDKQSVASVDPRIGSSDITGHQEVSISHIERGLPEIVKSGTTAEKITTPADHTEVYGALYESLFPQSFTSEVLSSLLNNPPQAHTEIQCHTERSIIYSSLSPSESKNTVPYSELTSSFSEVKSDSPGLIQSTVKPAPVAQSPAPPVSDYAASQGTDTQVTDLKRRVILVRELVTDEASSAPGCSSPGPEKMDTGNDIVSNADTAKTFSDVPHRKLSLYDGALSPTYFSVGSDDGSAVDVYYSAEEDNIQDSGDEEIYKVDNKGEKRIADMAKKVTRALEEQSQQRETAETEINKKDEGGARVVIVKMQSEESNDDCNSQAEVYHQSSETLAAGLPEGNTVKTNEKEVATAVITDVAEESKEVRLREEISETKTDEGGLRVVILKMQNEDSNDELSRSDIHQQSSDTYSAKILDEEAAITASSRVIREVKEETVLHEGLSRQEKIAEEEPSLADEGGKRVVIVKMLSEEGDDSNDLKSRETEVATEVIELREYIGDISKQGELPEKVTNQTEEGGPRVVIVKMQSVESNEEEMGDSISQTEVQQQSEISKGKVAKIQEDQVLAAGSLEVAQEVEEVTELREFVHDILKKEELPEGVTSPPDEGVHRVVIVKMQSQESTEEEKEDTRYQTDVQQQPIGQISGTLRTEFLKGNSPEHQKDDAAITVSSEVVEEVKEVVELLEDFSKQDVSKTDKDEMRVVIVKMGNEGRTEETIEDISCQTEVQPCSEYQILETRTTVCLESNVAKFEETEEATEVSPKVADKVTEVAELLDGISKEGEILEEEISKRDQDGTRVVCVKMNSDEKMRDESEDTNQPVFLNIEEGIKELKEGLHDELAKQEEEQETSQRSIEDRKEEMEEEVGNQTELQQTLKIQVSETLVLEGLGSKILGEEVTTKAFPEVNEGVGLMKEASENIEITEKETITKVVDIKKEKEEEIRHQNELQEQLRLQNLKTSTLGRNQDEKTATFTSPEVAEEVKENEDIAVKEIGEVEMSLETGTPGGLEDKDKILEVKMRTSALQEVSEGVKVAVELLEEVSQKGEIEEQEMSKKDQEGEVEEMEQMSGMHDFKTPEKHAAATALPEVVQEKTEVADLREDSKFIKDCEVKSLEKAAAINADPGVAEEVRDVIKLCENFSENGEISEKQTLLKDEEGKKQKEEENKHNTEVEQQLRGQSSKALTSRFLEVTDMNPQERELATAAYVQVKEEGEEERQEEFLAAPVGQVKTLLVCDFAPPSSELHGLEEGSKGNQAKELVIEDHPKEAQQLPRQEAQYVAHKDIGSPEYIHAASSNSSRVEERITPLFREAEKQVSLLAETNKRVKVSTETNSSTASAVTDTLSVVQVVTNSTERRSDATEIEHNRAVQGKTEWADTVTQSTDRTSTLKEQVPVELSTTIEDAQLPDTTAADTSPEAREPANFNPDLSEGSPTVSQVLTVTTEDLSTENPPNQVDQELDDEMMSGYSSLSTKLSFKTSSPPKEDETRYRVHKLSLTNESDSKASSKDAVDSIISSSTVSESNGSDVDPEYRWKNRFEGVSQFKPSKIEEFSSSDSLSYTDNYSSPSSLSSLSSTSTLPEATAYKHVSNASFSSTLPSSEDQITLSSRLSDRSEVYLSHKPAAGESTDERRRGLAEWEEPAAPAGEREREGEAEQFKTSWESHLSPVSSHDGADQAENADDSTRFTGVFKATLVELVSDPTAPPPRTSTPPASPDTDSPIQFDMDTLVDTLKSMGPTMRPRGMGAIRPPAPVLHSSLPPIKEDAPSPISMDVRDSISSPLKKMEALNRPAEPLNGLYTLPADIGLKRSMVRDSRSPLELMKQEQLMNLPLRASATNSIVMRRNSDPSVEDLHSPLLNGNGQSPGTTSRLDNSVIFGSYRSGSIDQKQENRQAHRQLFRTTSLPESGLPNDHTKDYSNLSTGSNSTDQTGSRLDRFAFLLNSPSSSGSLTGAEDLNMRMSRPPSIGIGSPTSSNSPNRLLSPTGSINLDHSVSMFGQNQGMGMTSPPLLQRSFSSEGTTGVQQTPLFNGSFGGSQFQSQEQERNLASKYRAFPDAYLTKEKEHGKLNPRPGKIYIFDQPGMCGQRIEVGSDVIDATSWELQETISIRVVRGGWVLYEKPNYKGEKIALDEGDIELTYPFISPEEELQNGQQPQNGQQEGQTQNGETSEVQTEDKPVRRFIIGSLRRAVRDYSVPEISLFPEENAEGKKVIFRDTSEDARIFGFPIKANSIIINAGLWLVYAHPFFQGVPRVLEVGGYTNPAAWGVEKPYVGSLHPLKVGEPRVENLSEPKIVIYDKPYFTGKSRTITSNSRDFMTRVDRQQTAFMYSVGSMKVLGGIWVGYEKEGYRGHQYLLEEGEYQDWRVWGGCDAELRSVRVIRADLTEPLMVMFEQQEDQEGMQDENTFEVTEAIPDVELFEYKTSTRSIHVLSGAWVAYSHVDFSGNQYILEKGFYNNCADWGSQDNRICSVQPILLAPSDITRGRNEVILYNEPDFQGQCHVFDRNQEALPERFLIRSCRVSGGSWVFYEEKKFSGNLYVLSEGDYPNLTSMGCLPTSNIRSVKVVPLTFSVPSISLFGLECLEGREITTDTEIISMVEEGFNNHILSVRVNSGCWVICEHSNYRGRQFLLEPIEITNWHKFSSLQTIGSMYPVRQRRHLFRIKNKERGHFLSIQGGVEEMKSGRVVVTPEVEGLSDIWFYQDGLIKSKVSPTMSLQVMGNIEQGAKVVLWSETRQPIQTWTTKLRGMITSLTFPGMVLDVKGGKNYDKDHVVIMPENEERPSQQWEIDLL